MKRHLKEWWNNIKDGEKNYEVSTPKGCIGNTLDDGEILYSEATISSKGRRRLNDIWIMDSGVTWQLAHESTSRVIFLFLANLIRNCVHIK
jgi:hypothetical protein